MSIVIGVDFIFAISMMLETYFLNQILWESIEELIMNRLDIEV